MANKLFESRDRALAHAKLAEVIADDSAPWACCTEESNRETVVVWDGRPSPGDIEELYNEEAPS